MKDFSFFRSWISVELDSSYLITNAHDHNKSETDVEIVQKAMSSTRKTIREDSKEGVFRVGTDLLDTLTSVFRTEVVPPANAWVAELHSFWSQESHETLQTQRNHDPRQ